MEEYDMKSIEVNGEFGQVMLWDSLTTDFSDWAGDDDKPFSRTPNSISIRTDSPDNGTVILSLLDIYEFNSLDLDVIEICSESIEIPSGNLCLGDLFTEIYLKISIKSSKIHLKVYVDKPNEASKIYVVIEETA